MSAVTHKVLSLAEEDLRSAKYRPRSWGLDGRKSRVYQVFIGQSDTMSYGPRSTVNCTIGCPGLQKVPFFKWQKMGLRAPKSKNGRQKPHETPLTMVDIWFMRFHFKASIKPILKNRTLSIILEPFFPFTDQKLNRWCIWSNIEIYVRKFACRLILWWYKLS